MITLSLAQYWISIQPMIDYCRRYYMPCNNGDITNHLQIIHRLERNQALKISHILYNWIKSDYIPVKCKYWYTFTK